LDAVQLVLGALSPPFFGPPFAVVTFIRLRAN